MRDRVSVSQCLSLAVNDANGWCGSWDIKINRLLKSNIPRFWCGLIQIQTTLKNNPCDEICELRLSSWYRKQIKPIYTHPTQTQHSVLDLIWRLVRRVVSHGLSSPYSSITIPERISLSGCRSWVELIQSESRVNGCLVLPGNLTF